MEPDYEAIAEAHGAKFDRDDTGMWRLLDIPKTVLWWAYFRDRRTAAYAYCLHHNMIADVLRDACDG